MCIRDRWSGAARVVQFIEKRALERVDRSPSTAVGRQIICHRGSHLHEKLFRSAKSNDLLTAGIEQNKHISVKGVGGGRLRVDFSGTDPALPTGLNAPLAVTRSAVDYVVCLLYTSRCV